jgi:hypothetical protein
MMKVAAFSSHLINTGDFMELAANHFVNITQRGERSFPKHKGMKKSNRLDKCETGIKKSGDVQHQVVNRVQLYSIYYRYIMLRDVYLSIYTEIYIIYICSYIYI